MKPRTKEFRSIYESIISYPLIVDDLSISILNVNQFLISAKGYEIVIGRDEILHLFSLLRRNEMLHELQQIEYRELVDNGIDL